MKNSRSKNENKTLLDRGKSATDLRNHLNLPTQKKIWKKDSSDLEINVNKLKSA